MFSFGPQKKDKEAEGLIGVCVVIIIDRFHCLVCPKLRKLVKGLDQDLECRGLLSTLKETPTFMVPTNLMSRYGFVQRFRIVSSNLVCVVVRVL